MEHSFDIAANNFFHFTIESILPIIDQLDNINDGDTVVVPDYSLYPIDLVKKILKDRGTINIITRSPLAPIKSSYLWHGEQISKVRGLCKKLISYVDNKEVARPSIFMCFRLHNRRWLPEGSIQKLINVLCKDYNIMLSLNPLWESKTTNHPGSVVVPEIENAMLIYDLSYEEQLSYAASADYAIYMNGAGMIFPQIACIPSVMLTPCLVTETSVIDINSYDVPNPKITVLSDKLDWNSQKLMKNWYADVSKVTVEDVLEAFKVRIRG